MRRWNFRKRKKGSYHFNGLIGKEVSAVLSEVHNPSSNDLYVRLNVIFLSYSRDLMIFRFFN